MPKVGFKSITVNDSVYDHFWLKYKKLEHKLRLVGITSFSGYIVNILENEMRNKDLDIKTVSQLSQNLNKFLEEINESKS